MFLYYFLLADAFSIMLGLIELNAADVVVLAMWSISWRSELFL